MKKRTMSLIFFIVLLVSVITYFTKIWTGRNVLDYLLRKCRGYYETTLRICQLVDERGGNYTAYSNGRYFYYDNESRKIYDYATHECIIECDDEIMDFCVNADSVFYTIGSTIYQYKLDGTEVAKITLLDEEYMGFKYVGDENIYCDAYDGDLYIFPAKNISEKMQNISLEDADKRTTDIDGEKEDIFIVNMPEVMLGFKTHDLENFKVTNEQGYIRIYNASGTDLETSEIYVMSAETGEEVGYQGKSCIGVFEEELYFLDDKIYRLTDKRTSYIHVRNAVCSV